MKRERDRDIEALKRERDSLRATLDVRAQLSEASSAFASLIPEWRFLIQRCARKETVADEASLLYTKSLTVVRKHLGEPGLQRFISAPYPRLGDPIGVCDVPLFKGLVARETMLNKFNEELAAKSP